LNSNSKLRIFFFCLKRSMILQFPKEFIINFTVGFVVNLHFMFSIGIIYEKIKDDILSY